MSGPLSPVTQVRIWMLKNSRYARARSLTVVIISTQVRVRSVLSRDELKDENRRSYSEVDQPPRFSPPHRFAGDPISSLRKLEGTGVPPREARPLKVWRVAGSRVS